MVSSQKLDIEKTSQFIEQFWNESIQPSLIDYIKIPNTSRSFDPDWNTNGLLLKAAQHIVDWIKNLKIEGITIEIIKHQDLSPLIFVDIPGTKETDTTLIYGHYDKQPPFQGWWEGFGPTIPVLKGDKLYGRGGADDGYAAYAALTAVKILKDQGLSHPRIVVMIEGDEESGSNHFPQYIEQLRDRIGKISIVYCLDSGAASFDTLYNTTSLRGAIMGNLKVKVLHEGVHSGEASGIVPSSFRIARQVLDRIEDVKTGEMIPELQVEIPEDVKAELKKFADIKGDSLLHKFINVGTPISGDAYTLAVNNSWKPYLEVTGADGLPPSQTAGNVMRPETTLKLSIRMPPTADVQTAQQIIKQKLEENPPYGAEVTFTPLAAMGGWKAPKNQAWLDESLNESCKVFFGQPAINLCMGGSIPLMGMLTKQFPTAQFVITGVLGPETNAHGPNEFLHIPMTKKLIGSIANMIADTYKFL